MLIFGLKKYTRVDIREFDKIPPKFCLQSIFIYERTIYIMTPEQALDKKIMLYCGKRNWLCFHINVGKFRLPDGTYFQTGVPVGYPDLTILTNDNRVIFCETKIHPRKPTIEQINFIENLRMRGFKAFVAYTLEEFIKEVENEQISYR